MSEEKFQDPTGAETPHIVKENPMPSTEDIVVAVKTIIDLGKAIFGTNNKKY